MKKILFIMIATLLIIGCNQKTPAQKMQEEFDAQQAQETKSALNHEAYIDSLVNVATGLDGVSKTQNRKNALNILRKEYPTMTEKWDKCEESIDKMEMYSE